MSVSKRTPFTDGSITYDLDTLTGAILSSDAFRAYASASAALGGDGGDLAFRFSQKKRKRTAEQDEKYNNG